MKTQTLIKIFLAILLGIFLISMVAIYGKVDERCWRFEFDDYKYVENFSLKNHSCNNIREMILLEIYPKELLNRITTYNCEGGSIAQYYGYKQVEEIYSSPKTYKELYQFECMEENEQGGSQ